MFCCCCRYEFGITLLFELQKEPYFSSSEVINMFGKIHEIKIDLTQSVDKPQTFLDEIRNWVTVVVKHRMIFKLIEYLFLFSV